MTQAQDIPSRQDATATFSSTTPGTSTEYTLSIDYFNPANPEGKPYAQAFLNQILAPGAKVDTTVPASCEVPIQDISTFGPDVCPPDSIVGGGDVIYDYGADSPDGVRPRFLHWKFTFINKLNSLIVFLKSEGYPFPFQLAGEAILLDNGSGWRNDVRPSPAFVTEPDNLVAVRTVRTHLGYTAPDGRGYITTPPTCHNHKWENTVRVEYRDGVVQDEFTRNYCEKK